MCTPALTHWQRTSVSWESIRTIEAKDVKPEPKAMAKELLRLNDGILESIADAQKEAGKAEEQGIMNFLAERDDMHKKWRWQLTASTK
jgi:DNA-binding ferritin-like protein